MTSEIQRDDLYPVVVFLDITGTKPRVVVLIVLISGGIVRTIYKVEQVRVLTNNDGSVGGQITSI